MFVNLVPQNIELCRKVIQENPENTIFDEFEKLLIVILLKDEIITEQTI